MSGGKHGPWTTAQKVIFWPFCKLIVAAEAISYRRAQRETAELYTRVDDDREI